MSDPLRELIVWRNNAVMIADHLRAENCTKTARMIFKAAEAFEEYLQDEFGAAYLLELMKLVREHEVRDRPQGAQVIPLHKGDRR